MLFPLIKTSALPVVMSGNESSPLDARVTLKEILAQCYLSGKEGQDPSIIDYA
jgi:hypothetical protein